MRFLTSCLLSATLCSLLLLQHGTAQIGGSAPGPAYPITVGRGGTGATTLTLDGVLLGNTTAAVAVTAAGAANQVLRVPGAGGSPAFGAVDLAQAAAVTGLLPDANIAASITRDGEWPSATATLTNKTLDAEGAGNSLTTVHYLTFNAGVCQGTTAGGAGSTPTTNAPAATCVTGTNTNYAVYAFDAATDESFQEHFSLPPDWSGNIDLDVRWRAGAITGSTVWGLQTACVAVAETADPAFNAAQTVTDAAQGVANQLNDASIATVTVTGCAAGEEFFFKVFRDADNVSDDMAGDAQLLWARLKLRRAQ